MTLLVDRRRSPTPSVPRDHEDGVVFGSNSIYTTVVAGSRYFYMVSESVSLGLVCLRSVTVVRGNVHACARMAQPPAGCRSLSCSSIHP